MRMTLIREKVDTQGKPLQTKEIAMFRISFTEKMKLNEELRELNKIFAGGNMNLRYLLEERRG